MSTQEPKFTPETQQQRWIKYGANVALSVVVVVVLAGLIVYLAQRFPRRVDTTATGIYSLKPQTVNLIKDLNQKIKLVSLYQEKNAKGEPDPYAGPVRDLLEEYSRNGKNIEFDAIDPVTQGSKSDALVNEAIGKYGGAVKNYKDFLDEFNKTQQKLKDLAGAEAAALAGVQTDSLGQDEYGQRSAEIVGTIREHIPEMLNGLKTKVDRGLRSKFPDYKAIINRLKESPLDNVDLQTLSAIETEIIKRIDLIKQDPKFPEPIRAYANEAGPRHEEIKKLVDEMIKKMDSLGELKVGDLQQAIKAKDLILVLGENDWRVIDFNQVWTTDTRDLRNFTDVRDIKPRFAGEQAVTSAILALTSGNKQKVAFVRAGGPPLTSPGFPPFVRGGPLSDVAERLRGYNFDVVEKDLSGMYAMQAQMQGRQTEPEPSDEEIKGAIWILLDTPADQRMGPSPVGSKLAEHLNNGGSAMVLAMREADNLGDALKPFGIEILTDTVIVHETPKGERARTQDFSEEVQRLPQVFVTMRYGDHLLTQPLKSLDLMLYDPVPVRTITAPDVKVVPLLPIPQDTKVWGERNLQSINEDGPRFDESGAMADLPGPFYTGALVEKGKSRLIVYGALQSFINQILNFPDQEMLKRGLPVARFPGNGELFTNSVFWLANMEPMIAISPSAMEVSRISYMSDGALRTWRVGVLLILLPGLVLAAGIWMYFARRD